MKIDKRVIEKLLNLNDDQLWSTIQVVAARSGFDKKLSKPADMSKLRETLKTIDEKELDKIAEILKRGTYNE